MYLFVVSIVLLSCVIVCLCEYLSVSLSPLSLLSERALALFNFCTQEAIEAGWENELDCKTKQNKTSILSVGLSITCLFVYYF